MTKLKTKNKKKDEMMKKGTTIRGVNFMIVEIVIAVALLVIPSLCYVIIISLLTPYTIIKTYFFFFFLYVGRLKTGD